MKQKHNESFRKFHSNLRISPLSVTKHWKGKSLSRNVVNHKYETHKPISRGFLYLI